MEFARRAADAPRLDRLPLSWMGALLSVGAAGVHFAVAPEHFTEYWLFGWFFVVVAWLQAVWAVGAASRPTRLLFVAGIIGNALLIAIWLWTRLVSVPIGPASGEAESFGWADGLAVALQAGVVSLSLAWLPGAERARRAPAVAVIVVVSGILVAAISLALIRDGGRAADGGTTPDGPTSPHQHE